VSTLPAPSNESLASKSRHLSEELPQLVTRMFNAVPG